MVSGRSPGHRQRAVKGSFRSKFSLLLWTCESRSFFGGWFVQSPCSGLERFPKY